MIYSHYKILYQPWPINKYINKKYLIMYIVKKNKEIMKIYLLNIL